MEMLWVKAMRGGSRELSLHRSWVGFAVAGLLGMMVWTTPAQAVQVAICGSPSDQDCCGNSAVEVVNNEQCDPPGECCSFNCQLTCSVTSTPTEPPPPPTETPTPSPTSGGTGIVICADPQDSDCCGNSIVEEQNNEQCDPPSSCCSFNCQDLGGSCETPTVTPTASETPTETQTAVPATPTNTPPGGIVICPVPGSGSDCCGNGVIDAANNEQCDVGAPNPNDCCTANCQLEDSDYQCGQDPCQVCGSSIDPQDPACPQTQCTPSQTPTQTLTPTQTPTATETSTRTFTRTFTETRTETQTVPPSATRTPTGSGETGDECTDPAECEGFLFCVDGVCCTTPCDGPGESCDQPGREGFCSRPQIAPAMSWPAQAAAAGVLILLAWMGLQAMRRKVE